jgi:hypothetical protein
MLDAGYRDMRWGDHASGSQDAKRPFGGIGMLGMFS